MISVLPDAEPVPRSKAPRVGVSVLGGIINVRSTPTTARRSITLSSAPSTRDPVAGTVTGLSSSKQKKGRVR